MVLGGVAVLWSLKSCGRRSPLALNVYSNRQFSPTCSVSPPPPSSPLPTLHHRAVRPPLSHPRPHTPFLSTYQDDVSKMSPDQLKVVLEEYKTMHKECKALTQKMAELDGEAQEHQ